jgi:endonuclease-3 related protein
MNLLNIYQKLLKHFGSQDWWPMQRGFEPPEWEVCIGAVLTQNTNWGNVELALSNLKKAGLLSRKDIRKVPNKRLASLIRPAGYYNQKAKKLKILAGFLGKPAKVTRENLLGLWGLGPETVDSILLYAYGNPCFVVDAYTRRVFSRMGLDDKETYEEWRNFFESQLPKDVSLYKEFHALIVELAKRHCKAKPLCENCPLTKECKKL